jgi:hypothetical protein
MSLFEKGRTKTGGRRKGVKDRIGTMFLEELAKDFEITDSRLEEISDGELDALIELARQQRAIIVNAERREEPASDREPDRLLQTLPETS